MAVYFITAREVDLVKIGYAFNPVARLRNLQVGSPLELALEGAIPGTFAKERELHERYAKWWVRGEWFTITPSIEDEIADSTRPTKYTWAAVRLWMQELDRRHDASKPKEDAPARRELRDQVEKQLHERMAEKARLAAMPILQRLEASGDIHFPFRQLEQAES